MVDFFVGGNHIFQVIAVVIVLVFFHPLPSLSSPRALLPTCNNDNLIYSQPEPSRIPMDKRTDKDMQGTSTIFIPRCVYTCAQVMGNEAKAAELCGISMWDLMSTAGKSVFNVVCKMLDKEQTPGSLTVLAGKGNNGGDGYVVATHALKSPNFFSKVTVAQIGDPANLKGDAATARDNYFKAGGEVVIVKDESFTIDPETDIIVDALFGTGLDRNIRSGPFTIAMEQARRTRELGAQIVSVDIPSGLHGDTGKVMGVAVTADATVTFIGLKQGLFTGDAADHVGKLHFASLSVQEEFRSLVPCTTQLVTYPLIMGVFKKQRSLTSHKTKHGKIVVIGGDKGFPGAIRMTAEACLRAGSGLVKVLTHPSSVVPVLSGRPELMVVGIEKERNVDVDLKWCNAFAVGPGIDDVEGILKIVGHDCVSRTDVPFVVDAGALELLQRGEHIDNRIITPHPGEAGRLLNKSTLEVENDRFASAKELHDMFGGVILLKGAGTIITDGIQTKIVYGSNPALAVGGSGDTLTGLIVSLLGQGLSPLDAAVVGACLALEAANVYSLKHGEVGVLASDLLPVIRNLVNQAPERDLSPKVSFE
eukprot:m.89007 g.89007  ORF g.89007 m.89007 type:complete len:590 (+) comp8822_c4_seq6:109-1878(+)